jgi:septal ring factor EnvC (AmiA/AmiB activator)
MKAVALAVFLTLPNVLLAAPATDTATRLNQAQADMAQLKTSKEQLLAQLQQIEKQYGAAAGSLREVTLDIHDKQQQLSQLSVQIKQQQAALQAQKVVLNHQLKAAFVMGKKEKLKLLLNQQDTAVASRMMVYYDDLNRARLKKLARLNETLATLTRLEQTRVQTSEALGQAMQTQRLKQADLTQAQQQRAALLAQLKSEMTVKSRQLSVLEAEERQMQALIQSLQKTVAQPAPRVTAVTPPVNPKKLPDKINPLYASVSNKAFPTLKGHLHWPVAGKVLRRFGSRRVDTRWDGVLLGAVEGADVYAVGDGRVVFADWLRGYGLLTIIDHGQGYMSLYAFNQSLYKKVGDTIKAGTAVAAVGKSDGREQASLYFGLRSGGKPINPLQWCK